ncbi:MAG: CoA transferase [Acidimicrobiia bacterium]|nr:CoA transferase [Actinomycetota bacterium]MBL6924589.1 CoA transferase [Acidimicrobiia bacterium]
MRPLDGLRVVDAATILAGPFAATILAEFGAEVVKVEQPGVGDPMRRLGTESPAGDTYWWLSDARNKVSVEIDLRTEEGADQLRELVAGADVLIENFRTGTMEAWGLGYEDLRKANPGLIQLSVSGYGRTGPLASTAGVARIAEAFTGLTHLTGEADGPPAMSGSSGLADYTTGLYGAIGVLLALRARDETGEGQMIDVALYDGIARLLDELIPVHAATGNGRERMGGETHRSVPHNNYLSGDGRWVTVACTNDRMFDRLVEVMGRSDLLVDERYATNSSRIANREVVNRSVSDWVGSVSADKVVEGCTAAGVPCGHVNTVAEYLAHPQVEARGSVVTIDDPRAGPISVPGVVPNLHGTPGSIQRLGGPLGEVDVGEIIRRWATTTSDPMSTGGE